MKISYNWLKWYVPEAPEANKLVDIITYHVAEVETVEQKDGDNIFEIKILPNRAHDLLSHQGLAHELSSLLDISFTDPTPKYKVPASKSTKLKIDIQTKKCRRYMGRIVRNVKISPSPDWVVAHLASIGQRSINNAVDAANLIMFDLGQPIHCFDLDKLAEEGLIVREAKEGEEFTTLDNREVKLKITDLIIADSKNVLGLAGIKGGKIPEVDMNTKNILIEVANFDPASTRKSARGHMLFTDAAKRFENGPTPELCELAMRAVSGLFVEYGATEFEDVVDVYPNKPEPRILSFSLERIAKVLGEKISAKDVKSILERYSMAPIEKDGDFTITVPSHRLDLTMPEDMAEEIGRVLGYEKIKAVLPKIDFKPRLNEQYEKIRKVREYLLSEGFSEIMTYVFRDKGHIEVMESASDKKFLRDTLRGKNLEGGFEHALGKNSTILPLLKINNFKALKIFEIGAVWNPKEQVNIVYFDGRKNTEPQELRLEEFYKTIPNEVEFHPVTKNIKNNFKMWSRFPFIRRDVAVLKPNSDSDDEVEEFLRENTPSNLVRFVDIFDHYQISDTHDSTAARLVFQSEETTLSDTEVNQEMEELYKKIRQRGWDTR